MTEPQKFRRIPNIIEAIQFTGSNDAECMAFCQQARDPFDRRPNLIIPTLEGDMLCSVGDWIVKGVAGEFFPVKPDIFRKNYEPIRDACHDDRIGRSCYEGISAQGPDDGLRAGCME